MGFSRTNYRCSLSNTDLTTLKLIVRHIFVVRIEYAHNIRFGNMAGRRIHFQLFIQYSALVLSRQIKPS
jgi:hypothetical protein